MKGWLALGLCVIMIFVMLDIGCITTSECTTEQDCGGRAEGECVGKWSCLENKCVWLCVAIANATSTVTTTTTITTTTAATTTTTIAGRPKSKEGEFCGGIAGIMCDAGLECRLDGNYPDAGGVCVERQKTSGGNIDLSSYYQKVEYSIDVGVPSYNLPLDLNTISNMNAVDGVLSLNSGQKSLLSGNGFVVMKNPFNSREESITAMYDTLKNREIPIFITTDSLLHLYHIQFDETLRIIEEREFYDYAWNISLKLLDKNVEGYRNSDGDVKEAYRRNIGFLTVALILLQPQGNQTCMDEKDWQCVNDESKFKKEEYYKYNDFSGFFSKNCKDYGNGIVGCNINSMPNYPASLIEGELDLIGAHEGFSKSPLFNYTEDYSQYLPRGHYTRSEKLKNYFKAFMWYGRMSFLLKNSSIIDEQSARIQTMQASLIATQIRSDESIQKMWDRIYGVTAFYVGFSDDLGPYEYNEALNKVFGTKFTPSQMDDSKLWSLREEIAKYRSPQIYGGTGDCEVIPGSRASILQCLEATKGFRMMGQRFIPDSYMFQNLVNSGNVGFYTGGVPVPFTYGMTDGGPTRVFPRGLDVMALLGSKRAMELLNASGDTSYSNYYTAYGRMEDEFSRFTLLEWNKNLYWSWLYTLQPLLVENNGMYPSFMRS
ncbi:MAG: DUF3160 domain-containing protein, partial [Candidatus Altiarchaeota archaeon]